MTDFENKNVVLISNDLYIKTPDALEEVLKKLRALGYKIKDLRKEESDRRISVPEMEKNGYPLWYARLEDVQKGKCGTCHSLIKTKGIRSHGHKCEVCGAVTYYEIVDGTKVRFRFLNPAYEHVMLPPDIRFEAKRFDAENSALYLYPDPLGGSFGVVTGEKAKKYLEFNREYWDLIEEEGQLLLKVKYSSTGMLEDSDINMCDVFGHVYNHKIVRVWKGKEYPEYGEFPIPESMPIYEAWHWAPLNASPTLHARILSAAHMVTDMGYYHQDGSQAFYPVHWERMAKFIRHFTTLDAKNFDRSWPHFRNSGPGGIDDLAHFCSDDPVIENQPNIFNSITALGKIMQGQSLTGREAKEAIRGLDDDGPIKNVINQLNGGDSDQLKDVLTDVFKKSKS